MSLSVNGSRGFTRPTWSLIAVAFFLLTLAALSIALRTIDVGIGYAVWAGIGAVGAAILGVVWLKLADRPETPHPAGA